MKKKALLLLFLACLLIPPLLVTRPFFWKFVVKEIEGALQQEGIEWHIEKVQGTPLSTLTLEGVEVVVKGERIELDRLSFKLSLPSLLQGDLKLYEMKGNGLHISNWLEKGEVEGELTLSKKRGVGHLVITRGEERAMLRFKTEEFREGDVRLSFASAKLQKEPLIATFHFTREGSKEWLLSPLRLQTPWGKGKGSLLLSSAGEIEEGEIRASSPLFGKVEGELTAVRKGGEVLFQGEGKLADLPLKLKGNYRPSHLFFSLQGPQVEGSFSLSSLQEGEGSLVLGNLSSFQPLFPHLPLGGSLRACGERKEGSIELNLSLSSFYAGPFEAESLTLFKPSEGALRLELSEGRWKKLFFSCASLNLSQDSLFTLFAKGGYPTPFSVETEGSWEGDLEAFVLSLNTLDGSVGDYPLHLAAPSSLTHTSNITLLTPLSIEVGNGGASLSLHRGEVEGGCQLQLDDLPLELFPYPTTESPFLGRAHLTLTLSEKRGRPLEGTFRGTIDPLTLPSPDECTPLTATARLEGALQKGRAHTQATLFLKEAKWFDLDLSLPLEISLLSPQIALPLDRPLEGSLFCDGRIGDLAELFNLGAHRLEGICQGEFRLKGSLSKPSLTGFCHFEKGTYENYVTGTELRNIEAFVTAEKDRLLLTSFTAQDPCSKGALEATGSLSLHLAKKFPFEVDLSFENFLSVQIDLVTAETSGKIHLSGNLDSALARGELTVVNTDLVIPSHIPKPLPKLQVTYLHGKEPPLPSPHSHLYPIALDLHIRAPEKVEISGRGLTSEWRGDFQVKGSYTSPAAHGKLELVHGQFLFAGRTFKLTEGSLSLSGKEGEMPWINLAGTMNEKGVSLIARLKGPLNAPQLTFQSVPPLPLSGILSYLLFGQDLSEINAFQAIELANTVASLSNDGSDVLENTRRSLGIDRLRVIASTNAEGDDAVAIQVGKYVAQGVIVSFTQGNDLSDLSVEVDLSHGFIFQAETQQEQEQGKFTIKWNLNY